jgi:hypothetical protein
MKCLVQALALTVLAAGLAAGCGGPPRATLRYAASSLDETIQYDVAVYQLARNDKVQIVLLRRTAAPVGTADPDFEYVFMELPERSSYAWVKEDDVPAYRWVRREGGNHIWQGTGGRISEWEGDDKTHLHLKFEVTFEPVAGTAGGPYILSGNIRLPEDVVIAQGLVNRYGGWLWSILGKKLPAEVSPPSKARGLLSTPKSSSARQPGAPSKTGGDVKPIPSSR